MTTSGRDLWPWPWNRILFPPKRLSPQSIAQLAPSLVESTRNRHLAGYGLSGEGKTSLLVATVINCAIDRALGRSQRGIGLIDTQGDARRDVTARLASLRGDPAMAALDELIVPINPVNPRWTVSYNPLQLAPGESPRTKAQYLAETIATISEDDPTVVKRMKRVLEHTFLALILNNWTLLRFEEFLQNREWREEAIKQLGHAGLTNYWLHEFPKSDLEASRWIESSLDRVGSFVNREGVRRMLSSPVSTINIRQLMDSGKIVLINAPKSPRELGTDGSRILCALLLAEFLAAAFSRMEVPEDQRRPFLMLCDEYLDYATESVLINITQGRRYGLELWLITQRVLSHGRHSDLQQDVLTTVGSILTYKLADPDAQALVKHLASPDLHRIKYLRERWQRAPLFDFEFLPFGEHLKRYEDPQFYTHSEIWDLEVEAIKATPAQHFWFRRRSDPQPYYYKAQRLVPIQELPNYHRLPELLQLQDRAAFELCGYVKPAPVPRVIYLPAPAKREPPPMVLADIPLWLPYPFASTQERPLHMA